jgi:hypothetical protein
MSRGRAAWVALVLLFAASRLWLALAFVPQHAETAVYRPMVLTWLWGRSQGLSPWAATARRWDLLAQKGRAPALEQRVVEYPPLALVPLLVPAWLAPPDNEAGDAAARTAWAARYGRIFRLELLVVDAATFALVVWLVARRYAHEPLRRRLWRVAAYVAGGLALCEYSYDRLDLILGALVLLATALLIGRARAGWALAALALAVGYKLAPATLVPLFVVGLAPSLRPRPVAAWAAAALATLALVLLAPALVGGAGALGFLGYHGARGLQVESPLASLAMAAGALLGRPLAVHRHFGAAELDAPGAAWLAALSPLLVAVAVAAATLAVVRPLAGTSVPPPARLAERQGERFVHGVALVLLATMLASKVLSPQYLLWLLPLVPLLPLRVAFGFVALAALTTLIVPWLYADQVLRLHPGVLPPVGDGPTLLGGLLLLLRNGGLLVLALLLTAALRPRAPRTPA